MNKPDVPTKITVILLDRHVAYLDHAAVSIRLKQGWAISRGEIIRALVDASEKRPHDEEAARVWADRLR